MGLTLCTQNAGLRLPLKHMQLSSRKRHQWSEHGEVATAVRELNQSILSFCLRSRAAPACSIPETFFRKLEWQPLDGTVNSDLDHRSPS